MIFKLLLVILTLLVLDTSAQRLNRLQYDLYRYGSIKNQDKRNNDINDQYNNADSPIKIGVLSNRPCDGKECNDRTEQAEEGVRLTGALTHPKRASVKLDLINLLRSLSREEMSEHLEPVIFLSEEFDDKPEK